MHKKKTTITVENGSRLEFLDVREYVKKKIGIEPTMTVLFDHMVNFIKTNPDQFIQYIVQSGLD